MVRDGFVNSKSKSREIEYKKIWMKNMEINP